jgi:hypothetical protein
MITRVAALGVAVGVGDGLAVGDGVVVAVAVGVVVGESAGVGVLVGDGVGVKVGAGVGVGVGGEVLVGTGVDVLAVGVGVAVAAGVLVGVLAGVDVAVGSAVGVDVVALSAVITSCGGVPVSREVKVVPSEVSGGKVKVTWPLPVTRLVTSYSTQVLSGKLAGPAIPEPITAGLVFQVIPVSVQLFPAR